MTDLTKITTPWGLLDQATRDALQAGGPDVQEYCGDGLWAEAEDYRDDTTVYRVKPTPPPVREWWVVGHIMHPSLEAAQSFLKRLKSDNPRMDSGPIIHVREVMPDE